MNKLVFLLYSAILLVSSLGVSEEHSTPIRNSYKKYLGRHATPDEVVYWLDKKPKDVEYEIRNSREAYHQVTKENYRLNFDRNPTIEELERWAKVGEEQQRKAKSIWYRTRREGRAAIIYGIGDENGTNDKFIVIDYDRNLKRKPTPQDLQYWDIVYRERGIRAGGNEICNSDESVHLQIREGYSQYLNRQPSKSELENWITIVKDMPNYPSDKCNYGSENWKGSLESEMKLKLSNRHSSMDFARKSE